MTDKEFEEFRKRSVKQDKRGKKIDQLIADRFKPGELVKEHMVKCGDDLILITLKGHLIIENLLEMNLCRLLAIDCLPKKYGELNFNHKLQLLRAVVANREPKPNADLFLAIDKLNQIRNQLAHNLKNQSDIEKDVQSFVDEYRQRADMKLVSNESLPKQLRTCIFELCRFLDKVRVHFYKLEVQEDD
jgi:hypothetical protein